MSVASHKMYGPKGVGVLYSKQGLTLEPIIHGASQEAGKRAGTENVASIVGMGKAAELVTGSLDEEMEHLTALRDRFQTDLKEAFPQIRVNAAAAKRLPNTLSVSFRELTAIQIIENLPDIYLSMGAACHRADGKGSGVLEAMGVPLEYQLGTLRISLGRFSDENQVTLATNQLIKTIKYLLNQ
jgi:cysteine desulfurase